MFLTADTEKLGDKNLLGSVSGFPMLPDFLNVPTLSWANISN